MRLSKPYIESIRPYRPGKPVKEVERELGLKRVVKLASNENPLGPSPKAVRAMKKALNGVSLYPEGSCFYLAEALSKKLRIPKDHLIFGNGSNEIIELLARGFVTEGSEVISSETSFVVYPILTQACGARFVSVPMKDFRYDLAGIAKAVTEKTRIIFIANPNNPTGTYVREDEIFSFMAKVPGDVVVCFDEAYFDFADARDFPRSIEKVLEAYPNAVVLRTFSKSYGLAGLRIGYGVASPAIISYLHKIRQPFNVNSLAQIAAEAALGDSGFARKTKKLVTAGRKGLYKFFDKIGLRYLKSQANFVLADTGRDAEVVFHALLKKGVIVRPMKEYGLPTWIRVTVGKKEQMFLFREALESVLKDPSN